jgi:hypothetical protein
MPSSGRRKCRLWLRVADLKKYRDEADLLRIDAAETQHSDRQRMALEIAALYDRVARHAKKRPEAPENG